ncbi:ThuA domain-containing protein [Nesterenkonia sp. CL21]|uniref:ThuA domain-containing protein n=1 Tax=Nesterenkonia sp. CL21 TaxID=3064894 RepID=UPI00287AE43A|nr:ThuA domain-containing protein [Nesterenkonia sp. CL21]MDS2172731.1 ThuA domain-containing protein [Nesterenkonia sp. CL21]
MTKRALIVRGGWDGHQPVEATELFLPFLRENGYDCQVHESPEVYADADTMGEVDLIVQCMTMSTIEADQLTGLRTAVAGGTGLAGWHGGIADSYRNSDGYLQLIGGQFAHHPPVAPEERTGEQSDYYIPYRVDVQEKDHPITRGIESFDLVTEQYWVLHDDLIDVLATTTLPRRDFDEWERPHVNPAVWTRRWGKGRVFVSTPGHRVEVLEHPSVRTIIERGMLWASR